MQGRRVIVWFRQDLRLHDNEALTEALSHAEEVIPVYVFDPRVLRGQTLFGFPKTGAARIRFLIEAVAELRTAIRALGSELVVRVGRPEDEIFDIADQAKTSWVFCNRERTGEEVAVQDALEHKLWSIGQEVRFSRGKMLYYTADLPFPVTHTPDHFTTFRKETERIVKVRAPLDPPERLSPFTADLEPVRLPDLEDLIDGHPTPIHPIGAGGEKAGLARLARIGEPGLTPDERCISPWLSHGCLSPKMVYAFLSHADIPGERLGRVLTGLLYRDYLRLMAKKHGAAIFSAGGTTGEVVHSEETPSAVFWRWAQGTTGLPIIDAAMQQLVQTGFMPCKVRQLCAHFLIYELGVPWRLGASYFESHLVDYDPCSNWVNWANIAGVGPDSRDERKINYVLQAKRLDAEGTYVKRWIPALRNADHQWIHQPDQAGAAQLRASEITLGQDYPNPVLSSDRWHALS